MPNVYDIQNSSLYKNRYGITVKNPIVPPNAPYMQTASGISIRSGGWAAQGKAQFLCTNCKISPQLEEYLKKTKGDPDSLYGYDLTIEEMKKFNLIDSAGNYKPHNQTQYDKMVQEKYNEIDQLKKEIAERSKDAPEQPVGYGQGIYRLTRGNQVSDSRCENPFGAGGCGALGGDYFQRQREQVTIWNKKNIEPLQNKIANIEKEILVLDEKSKLPYLRDQLMTSLKNYQNLEQNNPEYRQSKIDSQKSLYEQAKKIDELEKKHDLYGNIPSLKPEIITPDPIVQTTIDYEINKRPLLILGALGLVGLFLIWRFK